MIVRSKGKKGYTVKSHTSGKSFGTYRSKKAAKRRLGQMKSHSRKAY